MKPFLLLQSRPEDGASDNEYEAFMKYCQLDTSMLHRIRAEQQSIAHVQLDDYSGVIIGGGPFNVSDPEDKKSLAQLRLETEMFDLLEEVVDKDFPLLATCYGVGLLVKKFNGVVSTLYGEQMDAVRIELTEEGKVDHLLRGLSGEFDAFVAHKEACEIPPDTAIVLGSSIWCPVHIFRIGRNVYATQFHPEWDGEGIETRVKEYMTHGYFAPEDADDMIEMGYSREVTEPAKILKNFVDTYSVSF